jgi:hypothetical protein
LGSTSLSSGASFDAFFDFFTITPQRPRPLMVM